MRIETKKTMKKYIISLFVALFALVSFASASARLSPHLFYNETVAVTGGFEGQYVFRGQKISDNVASATVAVTLPSQTDLSVTGYSNVYNKDAKVNSEFDVTLSQGYKIDDVSTLTVGGTGYFYPKASALKGLTNHSLEAFTSLGYTAFLNPTVTAGYDFNLQQVFAEGSLSQKVKLPFLAQNWSIVPSVAAGWAAARDALPEKRGLAVKDSYYYTTGKVDLVYEIENVVLGVGVRYNYLDNSKVDNNSWVGGFVTTRF